MRRAVESSNRRFFLNSRRLSASKGAGTWKKLPANSIPPQIRFEIPWSIKLSSKRPWLAFTSCSAIAIFDGPAVTQPVQGETEGMTELVTQKAPQSAIASQNRSAEIVM
jgi:hypothetical protein